MQVAIRLAVCLVMAATSGAVFAEGEASTAAGQLDPKTGATTAYANVGAATDAQLPGVNEETGAASGEPRHEDPGARAESGANKGTSIWFPNAKLHDFADEMSLP